MQHAGVVDIDRIAFSPDGRRFMTAGRDAAGRRGEIRVWDTSSGEPIGPVLPHPIGTWALAISPDGKTVLSGSGDFAQVAAGSQAVGGVARASLQPRPPASGARLGRGPQPGWENRPDRMCGRQCTRLGRGQRSAPRPVLSHPKAVKAVAFSPDGKIALTGSIDRMARLWDVSTGKPIGAPMNHDSEVFAVSFSPNGKMILTASRDGAARLWDAGTTRATGVVLRHPYSIRDNDSSLGPDSETREQTSLIKAIAFSPDGKTVLTGSVDATARLWDVVSGKLIGEPFLHEGDVHAVAFSPDGEAILTSTRWKTHLWDAARYWS